MGNDQSWKLRLAVLTKLVKDAPQRPGRTALMKFAYLLQEVRGVPLGYRFELYNYGPYDATLIGDLSQAVLDRAIKSETVTYATCYGYEYSPNQRWYSKFGDEVNSKLARFNDDLDWVIKEFGAFSASRLELASTIVFAEREMRRKRQQRSKAELAIRVERIKPYFGESEIEGMVDELAQQEVIAFDPD